MCEGCNDLPISPPVIQILDSIAQLASNVSYQLEYKPMVGLSRCPVLRGRGHLFPFGLRNDVAMRVDPMVRDCTDILET
jgi:hypothetical protein